MSRRTLPNRRIGPVRAAVAALCSCVAIASFYGCSSSQPADYPPAKQAGDPAATAAPGVAFPEPTALPPPRAGDFNTELTLFDKAEMELAVAIDGKTLGGVPLASEEAKCINVCKALGSMKRSAEHICQLQADRCQSVKERVDKAEERARKGCPPCAPPPT